MYTKKTTLRIADAIFVFHCFLGAFILTGWLFPSIVALYVGVLLAWVSSWIFLGYCPLSKWEFTLRKKYNPAVDPNAEVIQYYLRVFFKKNVSSKTIFTVGIILFLILLALVFVAH